MNKLLKRYRSLFKKETATVPTFSYTINTTSTSYSLPLNTSIPDTMIVEWGDGSSDTFTNTTSVSHIYPSTGTYQIKIRHSQGLNKMPYFKFDYYASLISIDNAMLTAYDNDNIITDFSECFIGCDNLVSVSSELFDNNINITTFKRCFTSCISLTSIPARLFDSNINATDFSQCFYNCYKISAIPTGLFNNNINVTTFSACFYTCKLLTSVPDGLFDNNINVISFSSCFNSCTELVSIPSGLFDNNTLVDTFEGVFNTCNKLVAIPAGLFDNNVNATNFWSCFSACWALTTIPENLFKYNLLATKFNSCFMGCSKLQLNPNIFCNENTEISTRFANVIPNFTNCFYISSSFTGTKGTAPQLWSYTYSGTPTSTKCFSSTYVSNQITNAADVPTAWKG